MSLNFDPSLVPFPRHRFKLATAKVEGVGMNRLGPRDHLGIVFHRAFSGTQAFDDAVDWLRHPAVEGLTDGYIDHRSGEMVLINPIAAMFPGEVPASWMDMAGWANGIYRHAVASPDGQAFVNRHGGWLGASVINQSLESMEITGNYGDPISESCEVMLVQWAASRAQYHRIPWDQFPIKPADGLTLMYGHVEFCGRQEKICPGPVVWEFMNGEMVQRVREALRGAQVDGRVFDPTRGGFGFQVDDQVAVSEDYNLRSAPTIGVANILTVLTPGTGATIVAGPESADGYRWWQIRGAFGEGWIAEGGIRPEALQPPGPYSLERATDLPYPPGMDGEVASRLFGTETDLTFASNAELSRTWLEVGVTRQRFPKLVDAWDSGNGREYFAFSDGLVLWRAAEWEALRVLGGEPN